jgi:hypothetical protein
MMTTMIYHHPKTGINHSMMTINNCQISTWFNINEKTKTRTQNYKSLVSYFNSKTINITGNTLFLTYLTPSIGDVAGTAAGNSTGEPNDVSNGVWTGVPFGVSTGDETGTVTDETTGVSMDATGVSTAALTSDDFNNFWKYLTRLVLVLENQVVEENGVLKVYQALHLSSVKTI